MSNRTRGNCVKTNRNDRKAKPYSILIIGECGELNGVGAKENDMCVTFTTSSSIVEYLFMKLV